MLARNLKKHQVQCFSMTIAEMDQALKQGVPIKAIHETITYLEDAIRRKLPEEYHNLIDVFDRNKAKELPPHRSYDYKIKLELGKKPPQSRLYPISSFKL